MLGKPIECQIFSSRSLCVVGTTLALMVRTVSQWLCTYRADSTGQYGISADHTFRVRIDELCQNLVCLCKALAMDALVHLAQHSKPARHGTGIHKGLKAYAYALMRCCVDLAQHGGLSLPPQAAMAQTDSIYLKTAAGSSGP